MLPRSEVTLMGRSQAVRQRILIPPFGGSIPPAPASAKLLGSSNRHSSRYSVARFHVVSVHDPQRPPHHAVDNRRRLAWTQIDRRGFEQPWQHRLLESLLIGDAHHVKCLQARARQDDMVW